MGFFDFGDRATIQALAYRLGLAVQQLENEIVNSSSIDNSSIHGMAIFIGEELHKIKILFQSLSLSSQQSLKVKYNKKTISYWEFLEELSHTNIKVLRLVNYDFIKGRHV